MGETRHLTVRGRYDCIPTVTDFVGEAAAAAGLDDDAAFHCRMAVDEACTNVIEHAYGGEDVGAIQVTCAIEPGQCTIEIVDHGHAFDPDAVPEPHVAENLDELRPGGIGLHLMRKMMDEVQFRFEKDRNVLVMVKGSPAEAAEPESKPRIGSRELRPGVWLVTPQGRLDAASSPELEQTLSQFVDKDRVSLIIDMTGVTYISSRGLKTLVSTWRKVGDAGGSLALFGMISRVAGVFETVGFTHLFDIYPTLADALSAAK